MNDKLPPPKHSYSIAEVAEMLGLKESTLNNWRYLGKGPSYRKIGARIRYSHDDIKRYLASVSVNPEDKICG